MKLKLVTNWRSALRMLSVQLNLIGTAVTSTYVLMYDQLKDAVEPTMMGKIVVAVFILSILGRLVDQGLAASEEVDG